MIRLTQQRRGLDGIERRRSETKIFIKIENPNRYYWDKQYFILQSSREWKKKYLRNENNQLYTATGLFWKQANVKHNHLYPLYWYNDFIILSNQWEAKHEQTNSALYHMAWSHDGSWMSPPTFLVPRYSELEETSSPSPSLSPSSSPSWVSPSLASSVSVGVGKKTLKEKKQRGFLAITINNRYI